LFYNYYYYYLKHLTYYYLSIYDNNKLYNPGISYPNSSRLSLYPNIFINFFPIYTRFLFILFFLFLYYTSLSYYYYSSYYVIICLAFFLTSINYLPPNYCLINLSIKYNWCYFICSTV